MREAKTKAGQRRVPVHPQLQALIKRRSAGKASDAKLFDELKAPPSRPDRAAGKVTERFTAYRRTLGLDDRLEGRRQANADFHSFRRRHITKLEQAGVPPHIISALVGHEEGREFLALQRYSAGPSMDQLVDAVGRLALPTQAPADSPLGPRMGERRAGLQKQEGERRGR